MTTQETSTADKWGARTSTGREGWISVITRWSDEEDAYVTTVDERRGARWCPLEFHTSTDTDAARITHRKAARRHPANGNYRTLARGYDANDRCTRCGEHAHDEHHQDCRD
jgi:hypothetical protein